MPPRRAGAGVAQALKETPPAMKMQRRETDAEWRRRQHFEVRESDRDAASTRGRSTHGQVRAQPEASADDVTKTLSNGTTTQNTLSSSKQNMNMRSPQPSQGQKSHHIDGGYYGGADDFL